MDGSQGCGIEREEERVGRGYEGVGKGKEKWGCYESGEGKQLQWGAEIKIEDVRDMCKQPLEPESGDWE